MPAGPTASSADAEPGAGPRSPVRCSTWCREERVDPAGTAGSWAGVCCVEWPAPWPADLAEISALAGLVGTARSRGYALQLLHSRRGRERARIALYSAPGAGGFRAFAGALVEVPPAEVVRTATTLLAHPPPHPPADRAPRSVLICTHGRRDVCCGARGTALASEVEADDTVVPPDVVVARTSHLGGHRFAPTALVLPEGTAWAHLDAGLLRRIVRRQGPAADVADRYRGCIGLGAPELQVLERAVLAAVGWDVLDATRRATRHGDGTVSLDLAFRSGARQRWTGRVVPRRRLALPACGAAGGSGRTTVEWSLGGLTRQV